MSSPLHQRPTLELPLLDVEEQPDKPKTRVALPNVGLLASSILGIEYLVVSWSSPGVLARASFGPIDFLAYLAVSTMMSVVYSQTMQDSGWLARVEPMLVVILSPLLWTRRIQSFYLVWTASIGYMAVAVLLATAYRSSCRTRRPKEEADPLGDFL